MAGDAVQKYLTDIGEIYRTGGSVDEESYYEALDVLNAGARALTKPKHKRGINCSQGEFKSEAL
ncbi:MAG: hypothetical protein WC476_10660 [Phycisphaerae bacterium]|jgi:hypothetical protein